MTTPSDGTGRRGGSLFRDVEPRHVIFAGLFIGVAAAGTAALVLKGPPAPVIELVNRTLASNGLSTFGESQPKDAAAPASAPDAATKTSATGARSGGRGRTEAMTSGAGMASDGSLDAVKALYTSAAYEDALAALSKASTGANQDGVDQYRAMSLLALGRRAEAEAVMEQLLTRNPRFQIDRGLTSPTAVALVRDVKRRVLPGRVEALYAQAKTDFDAGRFAEATEKFDQTIAVASDPEVAFFGLMADIKRLSGEFRYLSTTRAAALQAAPARPTRPDADIYTMLDVRVKPPVDLDRVMPPWNPPRDVAWRTARGVIELIVNEQGGVDSARLLERIAPFYDGPLLAAAKNWRFRPAMLEGKPVKFRHRIEIIQRSPN